MLSATDLELHQLQGIVRAMHELAITDGVHDAERVMLRGFYDSCQQDTHALTSFEELIGSPFDAAAAAADFDTPALKATLLQSCILLAYADGHYSSGERDKVRSFARALGFAPAELAALEETIGDHLMQQISRIENVEALQSVAAEVSAG